MSSDKPKRKFRLLTTVIFFLNLPVLMLLIGSYLAFYIDPVSSTLFALAGLAYPFILLLNILFLIFWIFTKIKYAILLLVFILLGWNHMGRVIQFKGSEIKEEQESFKILSYNVQNFVKENVSTTRYVTDQKIRNDITNFIKNQEADIICIQEFLYDGKDYDRFGKIFGKVFNCPSYFMKNYYDAIRGKLESIATFSRFPMLENGSLVNDEKTFGIYSDLLIGNDTIRLYNLHLASIHFKKEDYDFINDITENQSQQEFKKNTLNIISKLRTAFVKRSRQVSILESHIAGCPYPMIVCGDFNDTPLSYAYHKTSRGLKDSFVESGSGFGTTFNEETFPAIRIDYIFHSPVFTSGDFNRYKIPYSDHYPISCKLSKQEFAE
ncbi:MAG: endonuclease/exonuclease/phosphatase family protein [Bacteroidales bacterium]|nr:endonuclease/exonuclease/phosphatase family protein [Bacteroidales bacterium]